MKKHELKIVSFMVRLSIAALLGVSLLAGLLPNVVVASAAGTESAPACCMGKGAGHCKLALKVKRPPREPICGSTATPADDTRTIIAADSNDSDAPRVSHPSIDNSCANQCSSCAARANQQLKQLKRVVVLRTAASRSTGVVHVGLDLNLTIAAPELELFIPRGPPVSLS